MVWLENFTSDEMLQRENNVFFQTFLIMLSKAHALFFTGFDACTHMIKSTKGQFAGMKYIHERYIHFFLPSCCLLHMPHVCRLVAVLLCVLSRCHICRAGSCSFSIAVVTNWKTFSKCSQAYGGKLNKDVIQDAWTAGWGIQLPASDDWLIWLVRSFVFCTCEEVSWINYFRGNYFSRD